MKRYMVVETFFPGRKNEIYARLRKNGRMLPAGLTYLTSWPEKNGNRCFQLMETNDPTLFHLWLENWKDLGTIEVVELDDKPKENEHA